MPNERNIKMANVTQAIIRKMIEETGGNRHEVVNKIIQDWAQVNPPMKAWVDEYVETVTLAAIKRDGDIDTAQLARALTDYRRAEQ